MIAGVSGPLVSGHYAEHLLGAAFAGRLGERTRDRARRRVRAWWRREGARLGPASPLRSMFDLGAAPLMDLLGFSARHPRETARGALLFGEAASASLAVPLILAPWGSRLDLLWSEVAREGERLDSPWAFCFNGTALRLCDSRNTFARSYLEFEFDALFDHPAAMSLFWGLLRSEAVPALASAVALASASHGVAVSAALRDGVREALVLFLRGMLGARAGRRPAFRGRDLAASVLDQAFILVYRVLFLLFAESRALVPIWHPIYRRGYSLEALRRQAASPGRERGLWEALQAVSRLAHAGCHAGSLVVEPFNGRLFAPARAPLAERGHLDDGVVAQALTALTTRVVGGRREHVSFGDLGVEQLGAVYESVLDYEPQWDGFRTCVQRKDQAARTGSETASRNGSVTCVQQPDRAARTDRDAACRVRLVSRGEVRKSTGTFYTPRSITEYIVGRTLRPLVEHATADAILRLRVLDPAMGSGALLVAACRCLAAAYEAAVVRDRGCFASDITDADRAGFRRLVAQHCLYGADVNPMAVQVARLSMWLTTLARGRPLSFLDHRFVAGDSLVGASLDDVQRQPPGGKRLARAQGPLPLFEDDAAASAMRTVMPIRARLADTPDDSAEAVHAKERLLAETLAPSSAMTALRRVADLWCACWFWESRDVPPPGPAEFSDLAAALRGRAASLPPSIAQPRFDEADRIASARRFLHWTLEFPEVFFDAGGAPLAEPGFDAIIGNPPWEMMRGDAGEADARVARRDSAARLTRFSRQSGIYRACAEGHANQYQLFVERSVSLLRRGGRLGLVLPWGLASDHGSAALRRMLFERCDTDAIVGFENSAGIFPIHRGVRFLLLTATAGRPTGETRCRFGERDPAVLADIERSPEPEAAGARAVTLTPALLKRLSGPGLAIPSIRSTEELRIAERLVARWPALSAAQGWAARFGRELNRSDDRLLFSAGGAGMPVVEGKHVEPYAVHADRCELRLAQGAALPAGELRAAARRHRLAYRDVASASNRLTLIAAIVPPGAVTVHTLFCLRGAMPLGDQAALCCLLNSFVANWLVRMWVTTHLGTSTVERLPVPRPPAASFAAGCLRSLGHRLLKSAGQDTAAQAEAQGLAAALYGLTAGEFAVVLETFPLVEADVRAAAAESHRRLAAGAGRVYTFACETGIPDHSSDRGHQ